MKIKLIVISFILSFPVFSQVEQTNRGHKELEKSNIGWAKMMAPNGNAIGKSNIVQGRTYNSYQIGLIDVFTDWIKKSYIPIGGLAQPGRYTLPDCKTKCPYVPYGTGISMQMWAPCYDNAGVKIIKAQPASHRDIHIYTQNLPGKQEADGWFNDGTQYFFTIYYDSKLELTNKEHQKMMKTKIDEIENGIELSAPHFIYFTGGGNQVNIVLTPMQTMPLVQLTQAEVLAEGLEAIEKAKKANKLMDWQYKEYTENIAWLKEKHKNTLQQPAFISHEQLTIYSFSKDPDLFDKPIAADYMFPVFRYDESVYQNAKKDQPLWVTISFPYTNPSNSNYTTYVVQSEIFNAMLHNFNYQFAYDYLFNPENVKGKTYEMRNPEILQNNIQKYPKVK